MNNKKGTKIVALIALLWIFLSIITTAILIIYENYWPWSQQMTQEQLEELLKNYNSEQESEINVETETETEIEVENEILENN